MSLFRRNEIWYASYSLPGGKRIKESLGTKDKRQAQELHDKRKAELWRVEKLGDLPDVTFEEACLRWLEEKADKKSLDSDKSRIEFWLEHFEGIRLKDISEAKIYSAVSRMHNRKTKEIWKQKVQAAIRKGKEPPVYEPKPVSTQTKAKHLAMIKAILRAAERDWKWLEKAPVIKIPAVRNKRVRWLEKEEAKRLIDECRTTEICRQVCAGNWSEKVEHHKSGMATNRHAATSCLGESRREQIKPRHWCGAERYRL